MESVYLELIKVNMVRCRPGDWEHCQRVVEWVKVLGEGNPDLRLLIAAAYIHDIGWRDVLPQGEKLTKEQLKAYEPEANHNSEPYARDLLLELNYTEEEVAKILPLIRATDAHYSMTAEEAVIVDADNLSKLSIDHLREKYQQEEWGKMVELWEQEFPKRIKTEEGKKRYPQLLADLKVAIAGSATEAIECFSCESLAGRKPIKPGPIIYEGKYWVVDHAYPSKLVGWLVIVLKRHAEAMHELTPEEYIELGELLQKTTKLLHEALHTKKEYVAIFAEKEGFAHIHVHIVPRAEDLPAELKGPRVFAMLKPESMDEVPVEEIKAFTLKLKEKFVQ